MAAERPDLTRAEQAALDDYWDDFYARARAGWRPTVNAFCPTGEGGGIDNSCPPPGSGKGKTRVKATEAPTAGDLQKVLNDLRGLEMGYDSARVELVDVSKLVQVEEGEKTPDYQEFYEAGRRLPPPVVVKRGKRYEVMDGNRRVISARAAGYRKMHVVVAKGFDLFKKTRPLPVTNELLRNAFCPTGEGGGIDNSCSPSGSAGGWKKAAPNTPAFKKWFKESQVVDESGEPLVVYHGTAADFEDFNKTADIGYHFGPLDQVNTILEMEGEPPEGANVKPVYLSIQNPLEVEDHFWDDAQLAADFLHERDIATPRLDKENKEIARLQKQLSREEPGTDRHERVLSDIDYQTGRALAAARKDLQAAGYDGLKYLNAEEGEWGHYSWIAFEGTQIKSALAATQFDPDSVDIRNREAGWAPVDNAFCPTGEGGGIDPTCSPGASGRAPPPPLSKEQRETFSTAEKEEWNRLHREQKPRKERVKAGTATAADREAIARDEVRIRELAQLSRDRLRERGVRLIQHKEDRLRDDGGLKKAARSGAGDGKGDGARKKADVTGGKEKGEEEEEALRRLNESLGIAHGSVRARKTLDPVIDHSDRTRRGPHTAVPLSRDQFNNAVRAVNSMHEKDKLNTAVALLEAHGADAGHVREHGMTLPERCREVEVDGVRFVWADSPRGFETAAGSMIEFFRAKDAVPEAVWRAQDRIVFSTQRNAKDAYWAKEYGIPGFTSNATGGDGTVVVYNNLIGAGSFAHEAGHGIAQKEWGDAAPPAHSPYFRAQMVERPVSEYGKVHRQEDFAEAVKLYVTDREALARDFPQKYAALHDIIQRRSAKSARPGG